MSDICATEAVPTQAVEEAQPTSSPTPKPIAISPPALPIPSTVAVPVPFGQVRLTVTVIGRSTRLFDAEALGGRFSDISHFVNWFVTHKTTVEAMRELGITTKIASSHFEFVDPPASAQAAIFMPKYAGEIAFYIARFVIPVNDPETHDAPMALAMASRPNGQAPIIKYMFIKIAAIPFDNS